MRINYNVSAMISNNKLSDNDNFLAQSLERLSSGLKLNHAKDNPAGLAMAKRMNAQIKGLYEANQNASDGVSIIETADGAMTEISEMLQRMNELAIQAATGTVSDNDRAIIQDEIAQLKEEITRISEVTEFNSQKLLNGNFSLKGYTNNIDVKVLSYTEAVATKIYTIEKLEVSYCIEEEFDDPNDHTDISEDSYVRQKGTYKIEKDGIELGPEFPEGATWTIKDDLLIISAENGFEMQLDLSRLNFKEGELSDPEDITVTKTYKYDENDALIIGETDENDPNVTVAREETITHTVGTRTWSTISVSSSVEEDDGSFGPLTIDATGIGPMRLQVGANEGQILAIDIPAVSLKNMGIEDIDVSTSEGALDAIARIDGAVHFVSSIRGRLGAYQNRLESTINNLDVITENITAAYSRIMDVDMAEEMTKYTTYQVLTQAGTSMLAQANERPSQVLQLLQ